MQIEMAILKFKKLYHFFILFKHMEKTVIPIHLGQKHIFF